MAANDLYCICLRLNLEILYFSTFNSGYVHGISGIERQSVNTDCRDFSVYITVLQCRDKPRSR